MTVVNVPGCKIRDQFSQQTTGVVMMEVDKGTCSDVGLSGSP